MRAGIFYTGTGPILILTSYDSITEPELIKKLSAKGIKKFIAYEVNVDEVKKKYGGHFDIIMGDLYQTDDLRVLDYNGHNIFHIFSFKELGEPIYYEQP